MTLGGDIGFSPIPQVEDTGTGMKLVHDRWWSFDKLQHVGKGMLTYSVVHITFPSVPDWVPFVVAVILASGYEVYDGKRGVGFSWRDAVCDTVGALAIFGLWAWRM